MDAPVISDGGNSATATPAAPSSFAEAFASDASPASGTPEQSQDATAAEQPTTSQGETPQQAGDERSPFIPRQRFDEVNGQLKELKAWRDQRAWADQLDQNTFQQMAQWYQRAHTDPLTFAQSLIGELQQHPTYGPQLRSMAAKTLASGRGANPNEMPTPDVQITDAQGNVVGQTYSDKQLALRDAWLTNQLLAKVEEKFSPVAKSVEEITAERAQLKADKEAQGFASGFFKELSALPNFADHKQAIAQEIAAMQLPSDSPAEIKAAAYQAYLKVVLPTLEHKAQSKLLDTLQHKAAASSSVNPGSAAPSTSKAYKSFTDLPADMWK